MAHQVPRNSFTLLMIWTCQRWLYCKLCFTHNIFIQVDLYGTVQPHTLIRQHLDYKHWYDRQKMVLKEVHNVQYVACMNPTAGSFTINPRLQRHFSVFAVSFPGMTALNTIYHSILSGHISGGGFTSQVQKCVDKIIGVALALHQKVTIMCIKWY